MAKLPYLISFVFILLLFNGCVSKKQNDNVKVGLVQWIGYAPLYVAENDHQLPQNLRIIDFTSNYKANLHLLNGKKPGNLDTFMDSSLLKEVH